MIQQTSLLAFENIKPILNQRQQQVYYTIKKIQPCSDFEISEYLSLPINSVVPRRNELVKQELVVSAGKSYNTKTKSTVMIWRCN